jgi:SAM-dependent methyltransferase
VDTTPPATIAEGLEDAACPLCGGDAADTVLQATDRLAPEETESYTVVRCHGCGLAYLRPRPTPQAMGRFYPESYAGGGRGGTLAAAEAAYRRRQHREVAHWLRARRPGRGRLLDVGCGSGDLLAVLRDDGWSVAGVEPSASGAAHARERLGLDVTTGRFDGGGTPGGPFDVVVLSGVLEHLHEPLDGLRRARDLLAPGGLVAVLYVPLLDSPEARLFGPRWLALDAPRHLTHFERGTFAAMVRAAGLRIVDCEDYSQRHSAAQLVGSLAPGLQKHRFYLQEERGGRHDTPGARLAPLARRGALLAATTAARPLARLQAAVGAAPVCSYFLEPAAG